MKRISLIPLWVFIVLSVTLGSCELFKEDNDCDATKMDTTEEPIIYIKALINLGQKLGDSYLINSERLVISGSIRKIYCSGKESGNFSFNPTFYISQESTVDDFFLPQPYQYKFSNTKDKLIVICHVKVYFENGNIYESSEAHADFYYEDIEYDANRMKYFIEISFVTNAWYEVTSK